MTETVTMTIQLPARIHAEMEALAQATGRTTTLLAAEAVEKYLDLESWQIEQIQQIQQGLREADAGDFATPEEVEAAFARWAPVQDKRPFRVARGSLAARSHPQSG